MCVVPTSKRKKKVSHSSSIEFIEWIEGKKKKGKKRQEKKTNLNLSVRGKWSVHKLLTSWSVLNETLLA